MKSGLIKIVLFALIINVSCTGNKEKTTIIKKKAINYYDNGKVSLEYNILSNGNSVYIKYYKNGKLKSITPYKNKMLNGECIAFYENGDTSSIINYINNKANGKSIVFFKNHKIWEIIDYDNGEISNINIWNRDSKHLVVNGNGTAKLFYENGNLKGIVTFKNCKQDGKFFNCYENGNIHISGEYKEDTFVGIWKFYNIDGSLLKETDYSKLKQKKDEQKKR